MVVVLILGACGAGDDGGDPPPDDNVVELTMDDDGAERGAGTTDADGVVKFYSPQHQAMFALDLGDKTEAPVEGMQVQIEATADGVSYMAVDPQNRYMPLLFTSHVPTSMDEELVVDGIAAIDAARTARAVPVRFDRAPGGKPLIVGLLVSINIRTVLIGIGEAAILMVLKDIVTNTCEYFAPLHEDTCGIVGDVAEFAGAVLSGGVTLALSKGFTWRAALGDAFRDQFWDKIREEACKAGTRALIGYLKPTEAEERPVQYRYRQAAYKYRQLIDKLDTMPPADPAKRAKLKAQLTDAGKAISMVAPKVRDHYYELYNTEASAEEFLTELSLKATAEAVKKLVTVRPELFVSLTLGYAYDELLIVTSTSITYKRVDFMFGKLETEIGEPLEVPEKLSWGFDCAMAIAEEAAIEWMNASGRQEGEVNIETALGHMVDMIDMFLVDLHAEIYGGDLPMPTCLPDIWESNDTYQAALASPTFAGTLGSGIVRVENLNACDGMTAADEDWFKMDADPINFNVEARIRAVDNGSGQDQRLCMQLYWYSQINELADAPPDLLPGGACGTPASEFSTDSVNVRQSIGEAYRYILVRVYPDPSVSPTPAVGIDYTLTFTH